MTEFFTHAQIRQAKRNRKCATCGAKLSGSETGSGYYLCLWCRLARLNAAAETSPPRPR